MTITQYLIIGCAVLGAAVIALLAALIAKAGRSDKRIQEIVKAQIAPVISKLIEQSDALTETQKAIILGQSRDAESRKALIDLLTSKKKEALEPIAEAVKEEIKHEEKAKKDIIEKVSKNYTPVD